MAEVKEKAPKAQKVYKLKSTNPYLYVCTNHGDVQFINGLFETTDKALYHVLLSYDSIMAV